MQVSRYHKSLRVALLVVVTVLIFDGGFLTPLTAQLSDNTAIYLGSVGSNNSLNIVEADALSAQASSNYSTYVLSALLALVIALMLINYIAHWIRARKRTQSFSTVQQ